METPAEFVMWVAHSRRPNRIWLLGERTERTVKGVAYNWKAVKHVRRRLDRDTVQRRETRASKAFNPADFALNSLAIQASHPINHLPQPSKPTR